MSSRPSVVASIQSRISAVQCGELRASFARSQYVSKGVSDAQLHCSPSFPCSVGLPLRNVVCKAGRPSRKGAKTATRKREPGPSSPVPREDATAESLTHEAEAALVKEDKDEEAGTAAGAAADASGHAAEDSRPQAGARDPAEAAATGTLPEGPAARVLSEGGLAAIGTPAEEPREKPQEQVPTSTDEIGQALKRLREERGAGAAGAAQGGSFWEGVWRETQMIEWPGPGRVASTTGVVVAIVVGSSIVLLTLNAALSEVSDILFKKLHIW